MVHVPRPDVLNVMKEGRVAMVGPLNEHMTRWDEAVLIDWSHLQRHGPLVFDEGKHYVDSHRHRNPGYLASIKKAFDAAMLHLHEPASVRYYREYHETATDEVRLDGAGFTGAMRGRFRDEMIVYRIEYLAKCTHIVEKMECSREVFESQFTASRLCIKQKAIRFACDQMQWLIRSGFSFPRQDRFEALMEAAVNNTINEEQLNELSALLRAVYENDPDNVQVQNYIKLCCYHITLLNEVGELTQFMPEADREKFGFIAFGILSIMGHLTLVIEYDVVEGIEGVVEGILDVFNRKMDEIDPGNDEEKIREIAKLFQRLEWLHPFRDGQGRTDLVLLNWTLIRYGLTPAILEETYFSSAAPFEMWVEHLKEGMARWQELFLGEGATAARTEGVAMEALGSAAADAGEA